MNALILTLSTFAMAVWLDVRFEWLPASPRGLVVLVAGAALALHVPVHYIRPAFVAVLLGAALVTGGFYAGMVSCRYLARAHRNGGFR